MPSQITGNFTVFQPLVPTHVKENIKAPRHWPLWCGIHRWTLYSLHKGPVTRKILPFHDVIVLMLISWYRDWRTSFQWNYHDLNVPSCCSTHSKSNTNTIINPIWISILLCCKTSHWICRQFWLPSSCLVEIILSVLVDWFVYHTLPDLRHWPRSGFINY